MPCFTAEQDLDGLNLWVKVEMSTTDEEITPDLTDLSWSVTSAADLKKLKVSLAYEDRLKYPQGNVVVDFTGSLLGPFNAAVAPFTEEFIPANITPTFNPNDLEHLELETSVTVERILVTYTDYRGDHEHLSFAPGAAGIRYHINDIPE
jgi:hypothetical protein